jgi:hypothetical protein
MCEFSSVQSVKKVYPKDLPVVRNKPIQAVRHPTKAAGMADHSALPVSIDVFNQNSVDRPIRWW